MKLAIYLNFFTRAHGACQLCNNPAPFKDKSGSDYLEAHHVVWLSCGGKDSTDNTVALCPNCHKTKHIVDDPADVQFLKDIIAKIANYLFHKGVLF